MSGVLQINSENFLDKDTVSSNRLLPNVEYNPNINDNFILCILCVDNMIIVVNGAGNITIKKSVSDDNTYMPYHSASDITNAVYGYLSGQKYVHAPNLKSRHFEEYFDEHIPPPRIFTNSLHETVLGKIDELMDSDYDWSEIGYEKPTQENIEYAKSYISKFINAMSLQGYKIFVPYISNSENGGATLKWNKDGRILYFDILYKDNKYTNVWDIEDKTFVETKELVKRLHAELWEWLIYNEQNR